MVDLHLWSKGMLEEPKHVFKCAASQVSSEQKSGQRGEEKAEQ